MRNISAAKAAGKKIPRANSKTELEDAKFLKEFIQSSLAGPTGHLHNLRSYAEQVLLKKRPEHQVEHHPGNVTDADVEYQARAIDQAIVFLAASNTIWSGLLEMHPTLHWSDGVFAQHVARLIEFVVSEATGFQTDFAKCRGFEIGYAVEKNIEREIAAKSAAKAVRDA